MNTLISIDLRPEQLKCILKSINTLHRAVCTEFNCITVPWTEIFILLHNKQMNYKYFVKRQSKLTANLNNNKRPTTTNLWIFVYGFCASVSALRCVVCVSVSDAHLHYFIARIIHKMLRFKIQSKFN